MPFKPIGVTTPTPGREPDVRIFFHGQLLLRSQDGQTCEVAVNHAAFQHTLSVEARTKRPDRRDVIHMRHFGPLNFRLPNQPGMSIEIVGEGAAPAAFKFVTPSTLNLETGEVQTGDPQTAEEDFRWIINLEGGHFHGDTLRCPVFGTHNTIKLTGGEYYFHTALRAEAGLKFQRTGGGKTPKDFRRIGAIIGANVFLGDNQSLVVRWKDGVKEEDRVLTLSKPQGQGVSHEIYIENTPLYEEPRLPPPTHSELIEYYKVLPDINGDARFNLEPIRERADRDRENVVAQTGSAKFEGERGSPSIPCQSIVLDGV